CWCARASRPRRARWASGCRAGARADHPMALPRTSWLFLPAQAAGRAAAALRTRLAFHRHAAAVRPPRQIGLAADPPSPAALAAAGFAVCPLRIDVADFRRYLRAARYERAPLYCLTQGGPRAGLLHEKALEHYVAARLLDLGPGDDYVDIAS